MRSTHDPILTLAVLVIASSPIWSPSSARAQNATTRASVASNGKQGDGSSEAPSISADGRHVAFESRASTFATGPNPRMNIFVHDRVTGATVRISNSTHGFGADGDCSGASISGDGRFVAFSSYADDLVFFETNPDQDVFVHDRDPDGNGIFDQGNGITTRVSVDSSGAQGDGYSDGASISSDGSKIAFWSTSTNLVAGDTNGAPDVFIRDRVAGTTTRVSVDSFGAQGDAGSLLPRLSPDGMVVAFVSDATNLVPGDTGGFMDVFVGDLGNGMVTRVSVDSFGVEGDGPCVNAPSLSKDGAIVAFASYAGNLVHGDTNGLPDIFVHDRSTATTTRVSVDSHGNEGNSDSYFPSLSSDGALVAFLSTADDLVPTDSSKSPDIFLHDRSTGATSRVSAGCDRGEADNVSNAPSLTADGSAVAYHSLASNLVDGDTNADYDVFVHDEAAATLLASWANYGSGLAGTNGIPSLVAQNPPVLGSTLTIDVGNSYGLPTGLALFLGFQQADVPLKGGHLLVQPALILVLPLASTGMSLGSEIPDDEAICGIELFLQALELDPGAVKGMSFSAGLDLVIGH